MTDDIYSSNPELSKNHPIIQAMNHIGYDAMTLGNHEFNFGLDLIKSVEAQADFPILSANTRYKSDDSYLVKPYTIVKKSGLNVAVIGLTVPHIPLWDAQNAKDLKFSGLKEEAARQVEIIEKEEKADVIVAVIHAGLENDDPAAAAKYVIQEVPEIDAFMLGHDHRPFAEKMADNEGNEKPIAGTKDTGVNIAKMTLELEQVDGKWQVKNSTSELLQSETVPADESLKKVTKTAHEKTLEYTHTTIGEASSDFLPTNEIAGIPEAQLQPTALISLINNVQRKQTGAQIAAASLFKLESDLKAGPIRYSNLFDIYKYANTLIKTKITGKNLKNYMEAQANYYQQFQPGDVTIAFNPNIRIYNYDIFSGVNYKIDISQPEGSRIKDLTLSDGSPIKEDEVYSLAVNNHRFGGLVEAGLVDSNDREDSDPDTLRGFIAEYIREKGVIHPEDEIEKSFEIVGYNIDEDYRQAVIAEIEKGNIQIETSADGRTPNVKRLNIYELVDAGLIDASVLKEDAEEDPENSEPHEESSNNEFAIDGAGATENDTISHEGSKKSAEKKSKAHHLLPQAGAIQGTMLLGVISLIAGGSLIFVDAKNKAA